MNVLKNLVDAKFSTDILNYADFWTKSPDASRTGVHKVQWFIKEKELFLANPHPKYNECNVKYTFNKNGVRLYDDNKGENIIACFGCSCTLGVGLPDEDTWPFLLQQKLGQDKFTAINFGSVGSSIDYSCRLIYNYLKENKPYAVVCYFPDIFRKEFFSFAKKQMCPMALNMYEDRMPTQKEFDAYCTLTNDYDSFLNFVKNFKFIEAICKLNGTKFVWHTWSRFLLHIDLNTLKTFLGPDTTYISSNNTLLDIQKEYKLFKKEDYARDGEHFGSTHNSILANEFAKLLNN